MTEATDGRYVERQEFGRLHLRPGESETDEFARLSGEQTLTVASADAASDTEAGQALLRHHLDALSFHFYKIDDVYVLPPLP